MIESSEAFASAFCKLPAMVIRDCNDSGWPIISA